MRIHLITIGEPVPGDGPSTRLLRTGILASYLSRSGHDVVWWTSAFDHYSKRFRTLEDSVRDRSNGYEIVMLRGCGYTRNVSLRRLVDHWQVERLFRRELERTDKEPDVIVSSLPTAGLCAAAQAWARARRIPVLIDIRDHWPDAFVDLLPRLRPIQAAGRIALLPLVSTVRRVLADAEGLIGITDYSLDWALRHARRRRQSRDAIVPLACQPFSGAREAVDAAETRWRDMGLDRSVGLNLIFFGVIGHHFDFDAIIAAARRLKAEGAPVRFVLCGLGDRLAHYQREARGLDNVLWPGWVDQAQIAGLMRLAHAGLAPYHNNANYADAIPNKVIEYLSAGLPVLTTLEGALTRFLERHLCGDHYAEGDAEGLVSLVRSHLRDGARLIDQASRASRAYRENFTPEAVYGAYARHLQDVVEKTLPVR